MNTRPTSFLTRVSGTFATVFLLVSSAHAETVSIESLLSEMVDRSAIARMPDPSYLSLQASSYNRQQVAPDQPGWFANQDWSHFIRSEERNGETEWVMMDAAGPGAVVRIWMPPSVRDGTIVGTVRVYLDHAEEPTLEMTGEELLNGGLTGPPLSAVRAIGRNLYLPIPYAKHCKITYDRNWWTDGQQPHDRAFYLINYRSYEAGTEVETFSKERLAAAKPAIDKIQELLLQPEDILPPDSSPVDPVSETLEPGEQLTLNLPDGPRAIGRLALRLEAQDMVDAMRSTVLAISFDGAPAVWCPAGDFFGTGPGLHPWRGWYQTVDEDGTMTCYWVMPYQRSAVIHVFNHGVQDVTASLRDIVTSPWDWDDRSLVFHSNFRQVADIPSEPKSDFNYIEITGQGMYVGDTLSIHHNGNGWWGEGDERIYVDGEAFPSHAGTGAEDYYGFAHGGAGDAFEAPFHAVPQFDGHRGPGHAVNNRTRALDAIPFMKSLKMDMEVSTTFPGVVPITHAAATHWYARPGATHNLALDTDALWVPGKEANDGSTTTLIANDGFGTSSFNAAGQWSSAAEPGPGMDYVINVNGMILRTPPDADNHTFAGDSLTIRNGGILASKATSGNAVITINHLIANNGILRNSVGGGTGTTFAGNIENQADGLRVEATDGPITLRSAVSGPGNLSWASGDITFANQLTGVNTYSGNTTLGNNVNLEFTETNQQLFTIQNEKFSNSITGTGSATAVFNGIFNLSTESVTDATGDWKLVDVDALTVTWGDTFGLKLNGTTGFTTTDNVIHTATSGSQAWSFDTRTGSLTLTVIPDP